MNRFERTDLVCGHMKPSLRDKLYPYVLAGAIALTIVLLYIIEVGG